MKNFLLIVFCLASSLAVAQRHYTYISDRKFFGPEELIGYDFCPYEVEIPDEVKKTLRPGQYSFGITQRNLYVEGDDVRGVYNVNNINSTEYGYMLTTINARDARLQGHLKVILNKRAQVEALIFKRSPDDKEMIFFQAFCPDEVYYKEKDYFTDRKELYIHEPDSLWGMKVYPFFRIHKGEKIQQRLRIDDNTYFTFIEEIIIEEKVKTKKAKPEEGQEEVGNEMAIEEVKTDSVQMDTIIKTKEIRNYYLVENAIIKYDDGTSENKTVKHKIKKIVERQNPNARQGEDRYQMILTPEKGPDINLYLTDRRTFSILEIGDKKYLARGH